MQLRKCNCIWPFEAEGNEPAVAAKARTRMQVV